MNPDVSLSLVFRRWFLLVVSVLLCGRMLGQAALPLRIHPIGDSITWGQPVPGGYRLPLYQLLTNATYTVDFVGTSTANSATGLPDPNHDGYQGWRIDQIDSSYVGWANAVSDPDIILLLIGTNDYGQNYDTVNAKNRLDHLIWTITTNRPNARLVVANVLLRTDDAGKDSSIQSTYNAYIPGIVNNHIALGHKVSFLDLRAAVGSGDLADGLHPNQTGYNKMAASWFGAITNLIPPTGTTNPPTISRVVGGANWTSALVTFSKPVTAATATNTANYGLNDGVSISSAFLDQVDQRTVTLTTSAQIPNHSYTLTVNNVEDTTPAHLPIAPGSTATFLSALVPGATNNVPEATNYTLVYSLNVPNAANYSGGIVYNTDNRATTPAFTRIAYYLELQPSAGSLTYLWVSMTAFTNNVNMIGVPTVGSGANFQRSVSSMNVASSVAGIVTGTGLTGGNMEFWPSNYDPVNSGGVANASGSVYDWGDQPTAGNYGSMQIHNASASQVLFAFNAWGGVGSNADLGIGNGGGSNPDWTFAQNAASYTVKKLQVYVLPAPPAGPPTQTRVESKADGSGVMVSAQTLIAGAVTNLYAIARDANGGFVSNAAAVWTLQNKTGGVVDGDLVVAGGSKSATFSAHLAGGAMVRAVANGFTGQSGLLTVTPAAVTKLIWFTQPGAAVSGAPFGQQPVLKTADAQGNPSTNGLAGTQNISVTLNAGTGPLVGTTNYNIGTASGNGVVNFSDLRIDAVGNGKQLTATASAPSQVTPPVGSMAVWLDASDAATVRTNISGVVTNWMDKSGNARNFTLAGGAGSVRYTNSLTPAGRRTVTFPGNASLIATNYSYSGSTMSVFVVTKKRTTGNGNGSTYQGPFGVGNGANDDYNTATLWNINYDINNNNPRVERNNQAISVLAGGFEPSTAYHLYTAIADVGGHQGWLNGNSQGSVLGGAGTITINRAVVGGRLASGSGTPGSFLDGDVGEVLVYNTALNTANRQAVESYLSNKWLTVAGPVLTSALSGLFAVQAPGSQTNWVAGIANNGDGTFALNFLGTPGVDYYVAATTNLTPPVVWYPLTGSTNTANVNGLWSCTVTNTQVQQYFRSGAAE